MVVEIGIRMIGALMKEVPSFFYHKMAFLLTFQKISDDRRDNRGYGFDRRDNNDRDRGGFDRYDRNDRGGDRGFDRYDRNDRGGDRGYNRYDRRDNYDRRDDRRDDRRGGGGDYNNCYDDRRDRGGYERRDGGSNDRDGKFLTIWKDQLWNLPLDGVHI